MRLSLLGDLTAPLARTSIAHRNKYAEEFLKTFGHHLSCYWRWHGFDIEAFAVHFSLIDGKRSISDIVKERFGDEAAELLLKVIDVDFSNAAN